MFRCFSFALVSRGNPIDTKFAHCVAYVNWKIPKEDPEALIVVAPSDHLVLNVNAFQTAIRRGFDFIAHGYSILTLGV